MRKVLVVEDDSELGRLYQSRLEAEGYTVRRATNCIEALTRVQEERPDLVIIDPHLGQFLKDAKGVWTLCRIKEVDKRIPVVIDTEYPVIENDFRYDQAVAQAQHAVRDLTNLLEGQGTEGAERNLKIQVAEGWLAPLPVGFGQFGNLYSHLKSPRVSLCLLHFIRNALTACRSIIYGNSPGITQPEFSCAFTMLYHWF